MIFVLTHLSLIVGLVALGIGFLAMLFPNFMAEGFGLKKDPSSTSYIVSLGARDVFIGLVVLALYFYDEWILMTVITVGIAFVALVDFLVVFSKGDRSKSIPHVLGFFATTLYSIGLLLFMI